MARIRQRTFKDARLAAVYRSYRGEHARPDFNRVSGTSVRYAYRTGYLHPDIPDRYPRYSAAWAAWCAGVDDKRLVERESGLTYHPPAQPRLPLGE